MVQTHIRTTTKASWTGDQLKAAIDAVRKKELKIREAGRKFGIHEATIRKRMQSCMLGGPSMGRNPVFTKTQEEEMACRLLSLAKIFHGVTMIELRRIAFEFAARNNIENNFNKESKLAGRDWVVGFLKRNPELSLRKPEATSINRILAFNKIEVDRFFNNLMAVMEKYKFAPSRIF